MNNRKIGNQKEELAAAYLSKYGFRTVEKNFRIRQGEIDIIGYDQEVLVFVEVKYRANQSAGLPEEAVSLTKQRQICKTAMFYLQKHRLGIDIPCRYDVVAIEGETIRWYRNAFEHQDCI
jgi:putative endonuclease